VLPFFFLSLVCVAMVLGIERVAVGAVKTGSGLACSLLAVGPCAPSRLLLSSSCVWVCLLGLFL
jgi:hypothetical protein